MLQQKVLKGDERDKSNSFWSYKDNCDNIIRRKEFNSINDLYSYKYNLDIVLYKRKYYSPEVLLEWSNNGKYTKYIRDSNKKML